MNEKQVKAKIELLESCRQITLESAQWQHGLLLEAINRHYQERIDAEKAKLKPEGDAQWKTFRPGETVKDELGGFTRAVSQTGATSRTVKMEVVDELEKAEEHRCRPERKCDGCGATHTVAEMEQAEGFLMHRAGDGRILCRSCMEKRMLAAVKDEVPGDEPGERGEENPGVIAGRCYKMRFNREQEDDVTRTSLMEDMVCLNNRIGEQEMEIANLRCHCAGLEQHVVELEGENRQLGMLVLRLREQLDERASQRTVGGGKDAADDAG